MAANSTMSASSLASPESEANPRRSRPSSSTPNIEPRTPSKPSRTQGFLSLPNTSPWHRDEARCVLSDIHNFIAIGCLTSPSLMIGSSDAVAWTEVFDIDEALDLRLRKQLQALVSAGWIRVFACTHQNTSSTILRIYMLAGDVGHRTIQRADKDSKGLFVSLRDVVAAVDTSPTLWQGVLVANHSPSTFDFWAKSDSESLFWMFNNIPSPSPSTDRISDCFRRRALRHILEDRVRGLHTKLYPYQRRSAGQMLQRECESELFLDPRLERRTAPDGKTYYYGARDFHFLRQARQYEAVKGGILAETMGLGKTVISLALILSTRGSMPRVPVEYDTVRSEERTRSLVATCVAATHRHSIPWRSHFEELEGGDQMMTECTSQLRYQKISYEIPQMPPRFNRTTTVPPPKIKTLAATTIVVVPRNLCSQWQSEISRHVHTGSLNVLVMEDLRKELPTADELRKYDLILFSRNRFEQESRDGSDRLGRRMCTIPAGCNCPYIGSTRTRDCTCLQKNDLYNSPLRELHFLRIIIDEGHSFSSHTSAASHVAEKLVTADHRWVVSGTPAKDLLGVEMDLYSSEQTPMALNDEAARSSILEHRKSFNARDDTIGAVKSIGNLMTHFLQTKPWSGGQGEVSAVWDEYIYRHEDLRKKTYSGFSRALRQSLEAVVIKTRPEDVERDIELPPLSHKVVRLEPSYFDKATANLFTFVLAANAITSERTDQDYLFHKDSLKARCLLISNLRQSAFFWTGFSAQEVLNGIGNCERYLVKEGISCSEDDKAMLRECIWMARSVLGSSGWNGMSATHELGLTIEDWPEDSAEHWTLDGIDPVLTGATQIADAQAYVYDQIGQEPLDLSLAGEGIKALSRARAQGRAETKAAESTAKNAKLGIPSSSVNGEPTRKRSSPTKKMALKSPKETYSLNKDDAEDGGGPKKKRKRSSTESVPGPTNPPHLPPDSPLNDTRLTGTVSAKASYLISRILALHKQEKILIFYTGENSAYYLAQILEILHIPHLIYARGLPASSKSEYIVKFNDDARYRVLLMDVGQAAYGLNISCASRVFFVNPVCRPHIEAQAIKRAHRIGQTREVKVETLVLKGTIEEGMYERARRMSRAEHREAKVLEDDGGVKEVIQSARLMPLDEGERYALLETRERVFGREGWWEYAAREKGYKGTKRKASAVETEPVAVDEDDRGRKPRKRRKKAVGFTDSTIEQPQSIGGGGSLSTGIGGPSVAAGAETGQTLYTPVKGALMKASKSIFG